MRFKKLNKRFLSFFLAIILGFTCIFEFSKNVFADDNLGTWVMKTPMNEKRGHFGLSSANGKIYAMNGYDSNTVEEYDPSTDKWTYKAPMNEVRADMKASSINNKIYAIGGVTTDGKILSTVEEYDPMVDKWTNKASMNQARLEFGLATLNGKIYVMGGYASDGNTVLNTVEEYDPTTDKWTNKAPMNFSVGRLQATACNGKIYAVGGLGDNGCTIPNTIEEYDPSTDKWITKEPIKMKAWDAFGVVTLNNKIYIIGGLAGCYLNAVEEYDPVTNKLTDVSPMNILRGNLGVTVLNNKIYAVGGTTDSEYLNTVEEYTPSENISSIPTNLTARAGDAKVNLSWDAASGTTYNIKRSETSGGPYTTIGTSTQAIYTDTKVTNGKTYYYVVTAVNGTLESENSNEVQATPNADNSIVLNKTTDTINVGQTDNLTAKTMPSGIGVTWSSSDSGIASVDNNGTVTGVKEGTATITCTTKDGKTAECIVTVTKSSASPSESGNRAVLTIEMNNGKTKEYDLSKDELNAFVTWYDSRSKGTAAAYYVFDAPATGSYINKKDTISFNQINDYEVQEYNK